MCCKNRTIANDITPKIEACQNQSVRVPKSNCIKTNRATEAMSDSLNIRT